MPAAGRNATAIPPPTDPEQSGAAAALGYARNGRRPHRRARAWLLDGLLLIALLAIVVGGAALYVRQERVFYWYDLAGYHNGARGLAELYRQSPAAARRATRDSLAQDYNALYAVPLLPVLLVCGTSRQSYVAALAAVYLLPFALALGAIAVRLIPARPRPVFWSTAVLALLLPPTWLPTLRGYPDTGAALLVAGAVWLYLGQPRLTRPWQAPAIGASLAAAILFRRHFAYAGVAFFGAAGLLLLTRCAIEARGRPRRAALGLVAGGLRLGLAAGATLLALALVDRDFLARILTSDYQALYASYMRSPGEMLRWVAAGYGGVALLGAAAGLVLGGRGRAIRHEAALFVALFGGLALLVWLLYVRQPGPHYTLHFTPPVVLGLAALGWLLRRRAGRRLRSLAPGVLAALLVANLLAALAPPPAVGPARPLLAAGAAPLRRADYDEVARLVRTLRDLTPERQGILIAASSDLLNRDIVANAERTLYGEAGARLGLLDVPEIDSRDWYPLDQLLPADYVVIVEPFQHHLPAERQEVIRAVVELFAAGDGLARDFAPLPDRFTLAGGATVTIQRRARPTSLATALETLQILREGVPRQPGGQPDWQSFRLAPPTAGGRARDGAFWLTTQPIPPAESGEKALLYMGRPPARPALTGQVTFEDRRCAGVILRVAGVDPRGQVTAVAELPRRPGDTEPFGIAVPRVARAARPPRSSCRCCRSTSTSPPTPARSGSMGCA